MKKNNLASCNFNTQDTFNITRTIVSNTLLSLQLRFFITTPKLLHRQFELNKKLKLQLFPFCSFKTTVEAAASVAPTAEN